MKVPKSREIVRAVEPVGAAGMLNGLSSWAVATETIFVFVIVSRLRSESESESEFGFGLGFGFESPVDSLLLLRPKLLLQW